MKQDPRWNAEQLPGGYVRWTTPSGRQYVTRTDPVPHIGVHRLYGGQPPETGGGWTTIAADGTIVSRPVYGGSKGGPSWATGSSIRTTRNSNSQPGTWA